MCLLIDRVWTRFRLAASVSRRAVPDSRCSRATTPGEDVFIVPQRGIRTGGSDQNQSVKRPCCKSRTDVAC